VIVTAGAAFAVSKHERKQYTASASVLFNDTQLDQVAAGLPTTATANPQADTDTNLKLAELPRIAAATASIVGRGLTNSDISADVTVEQEGDTNLASISATAASPSLAADIANAYAAQLIAYRQSTDRSYYANALTALNLQFQALTPAQQNGAQGAALKDRASSLRILGQLEGSDVQLAQSASAPGGPSSPKVLRDTALGALLGLLLGLGLAFLAERFDRRLREPSDLEAVYGAPLLAVVPESNSLRAEARTSETSLALPPEEAEIFGLLRAHIRYFNVDHELRQVVVVSASPGDGKTTIARNLVIAAGLAGARALFIEADLRRPSASRHFGIEHATEGVVDVLIGGTPLQDAVQCVHVNKPGQRMLTVDVLLAGTVLPPNPVQTLESEAMKALLQQTKSMYDLVVVDTPPVALLSDAFPLVRSADGIVIVSRLGRNSRDAAVRLRKTLASSDAPVVGVVANGYRGHASSYYGHRYGEYAAADSLSDSEKPPPVNGTVSANGTGGPEPADSETPASSV